MPFEQDGEAIEPMQARAFTRIFSLTELGRRVR
jgi:hypothetical protein